MARPVVLFDFDGTLVDTHRSIVSCLQQVLPRYGVVLTDDELMTGLGPPFHVTWRQYGMAEEDFDRCLAEYRALYTAGAMYDLDVYEGINELLARLNDAGVRLGVATSKAETYTGDLITHLGWSDVFEVVTGAALDGSLVHKGDIIAESMNRLGVDAAVMVGDRDVDIVGAHACGIDGIGVLWGFGNRAELEDAGADGIVDTPDALAELLLRPAAAPSTTS